MTGLTGVPGPSRTTTSVRGGPCPRAVLGLALAALALTGCAGEPERPDVDGGVATIGPTEQVDADGVWVAEQLEFLSAPDALPAGGATLALEVRGGLPHNILIEGVTGEDGDDAVLVDAAGIGVFTGEVDLEPGTYTYYCNIAGHRAAGMEGTLTAG